MYTWRVPQSSLFRLLRSFETPQLDRLCKKQRPPSRAEPLVPTLFAYGWCMSIKSNFIPRLSVLSLSYRRLSSCDQKPDYQNE